MNGLSIDYQPKVDRRLILVVDFLQESVWKIYDTDEFSLQHMHRKISTTNMNRHQHVEPPSTSWTTIDMNHQHWRHQHESRDPRPLDLPTCSNRRIGMRPPRCLGVFQVAEDTDLRGKQFRYYESHAIHVWCIFTYIYLQHLVNLRWCVFFRWFFEDWDPMKITMKPLFHSKSMKLKVIFWKLHSSPPKIYGEPKGK